MNGFLSHKKIMCYICAVLSTVLCALCLVSCNRIPENGEDETSLLTEATTAQTAESSPIRLPYSSQDSLNPFFMKSLMNSSFVGLVFRSLYKMDAEVDRVNDMAVSETVLADCVRVSFVSDSIFSDGSLMTARDVVYSFNLAKESFLYSSELSGISQAFLMGDYSVEFTLASPDVFSLNSLVFPIVKSGTADTADAVPTGSGQYMYSSREDDRFLTENLFAEVSPAVREIELTYVEDDASLIFMLETGRLDACFSELTEGEVSRIDAATREVAMNNLVFLGFNPAKGEFLVPEVRRAVSLLLDREEIVENAFFYRADASVIPVHPKWNEAESSPFAESVSVNENVAGALQLLTDSGFSGVSGYGIRYGGATAMQYTLLYCSDTQFKTLCAELIAEKLTAQGIIITLKGLTYNDYIAAKTNGEYDLFLGEIRLPYNMSLSVFFSADGTAYCGACISLSLSNFYSAWRAGTVSTDTFLSSFYEEMPFIPLCMRSGVLCYSRSIKSSVTASKLNPYDNISEWTVG